MKKESGKYIFYRRVLLFTAICMLGEMLWPTVAFALTSGPAQPEFSSFEPVATTNMVSDFTGDFTYNIPVVNIPGANGAGYALSLSYHAGASPEEEASWVGYGWTLNPGAINRSKKGFPDDCNGSTVKYWNKAPKNQTVTLGAGVGTEIFSKDLFKSIGISVNASLRYNNYKGFGLIKGAGVSYAKGLVSLGYSSTDGEGSFSARVNPMALLSKSADDEKKVENKTGTSTASDPSKNQGAKNKLKERLANSRVVGALNSAMSGAGLLSLNGSQYGIYSHSFSVRNTSLTKYTGASYNFSASGLPTFTVGQLGLSLDISGSYSYQENVNKYGNNDANPLATYGYMYNAKAPSNSDAMMDYYMEKLTPFDKQDKYIGMPFSNADNYAVTGEGLGGGFRIYNKQAGHFHPNVVSSRIKIYNLGAEFEGGLNTGGGTDIGVGFQSFSSNNWDNATVLAKTFVDSASGGLPVDEPNIFRFNNDAGGSVEFGSNNSAQQADLHFVNGGAGNKSFTPEIPSSMPTVMNNEARSGRSSYIAYHTNKEMLYQVNNKAYKRYHLGDTTQTVYRRNLSDGVGEFTTFNEDGNRYVYGLPVYSRKEGNLQYDLENVLASKIDSNYLAYRDVSTFGLKTKVGEERDAPYATSYLLTEITSPDYTDRTMNGATDDDFGAYTRFSYNRKCGTYDKVNGSSSSWYRWRIPYRGLLMSRGELSTQKDDMGSATYGEKEMYYLDTIITKTHYAVFYTSNRFDGYNAPSNNTAANSKTAIDSTQRMQKLDSIVVYSRNQIAGGASQKIKKVVFSYDYSLCTNLPNSGKYDATHSRGKLTLKRVWFEYNGIVPAKITPYDFDYAYPGAGVYPAKYSSLGNYGSGKIENPVYSPFSIDAWGNYQYKGSERFDSLRTWVNQRPTAAFDPAAWQLKKITLPSGGEIHVQYEQDDYAYVQDKLAHAMVSLQSSGSSDNLYKYYLQLKDIGLSNGSSTDRKNVVRLIYDNYVAPGKKIYFKFLYKLIGSSGAPDRNDCNAEYIDGYCTIDRVVDDGSNGVYIKLKTGASGSKFDLPSKVCVDYVKTQRIGTLNTSGNCNPATNGLGSSNDPKKIVLNLLAFLKSNFYPGNSELCVGVNYPLSYFRIPMPVAKKGGGLRVKRILMYDAGIENGDKNLYGSEYSYVNEDGTSSGVAVNEPQSIREENALVEFDPKNKQSFINKLVSGRDKERHELPLGETVLPGASVGYSRVVIKNIYSGKTNTGFAVKEFYTAKDYPVTAECTSIKEAKDFLPMPLGLINRFISNAWLTQGYAITLNSMHGQPKAETTYKGDPSAMSSAMIGSRQEYNYYAPGESVPVMTSVTSIVPMNLGKETELTFESRGVEDIAHNIAYEFDGDVGFAFIPIPFLTGKPSYTYNESKLYSHTTTKVINYPAILKSTTSTVDGIVHVSENVAFNPSTGKPILTRTYDGYNKLNLQQSSNQNGTYLAYTIPASMQYKAMGQKATSERAIFVSDPAKIKIELLSTGSKYYLNFTPSREEYYCTYTGKYCPGDLIRVTRKSDGLASIFNVTDSIVGGQLFVSNAINFYPSGPTFNTGEVVVEVLRSGCTNQLSSTAGGFTTYGVSDNAFAASNSTVLGISGTEYQKRVRFAYVLDSVLQATPIGGTGRVYREMIPYGINYMECGGGGGCDTTKTNVWNFANPNSYVEFRPKTDSIGMYCHNICVPQDDGGKYLRYTQKNNKGHVGIDPVTAQLVWYTGSYEGDSPGGICNLAPFDCLNFCEAPSESAFSTSANVVEASAQTYSDNWSYDTNIFDQLSGSNKYENASKGKWRKQNNYVYNDTIIGANAGTQRNYKNAGVFTMQLFNYKTTTSNDPDLWIKTDSVTQFSPDGNALEEQDIFGIYSAAKFGYDRTQPYLVAKNSSYSTAQFDGFEKYYGNYATLEDGWAPASINPKRTNTYAHSGQYSWKLTPSDSISLKVITANSQVRSKGLLLKVWVKDATATLSSAVKGKLKGNVNLNITFNKVARTGEWILFEANVSSTDMSSFTLNSSVTPLITNNYSGGGQDIWIDDVRVQPADAQMITYVYDLNNLRLITSFDDQHFGLYYQYNAEGKLVRKMKETEKGLKTITETQYHTPLKSR